MREQVSESERVNCSRFLRPTVYVFTLSLRVQLYIIVGARQHSHVTPRNIAISCRFDHELDSFPVCVHCCLLLLNSIVVVNL